MGLIVLGACFPARKGQIPATPTFTPYPSPTFTAVPSPTPTALPEGPCPVSNLLTSQHISATGSYTETETEAAGPMLCRIERGSCGYHRLVGNLDPSIIFKKEEEPPYDEEDILMHPSMIFPLNKLSQMVQEEWQGEVSLRITDAYDSLLEHDLSQTDESRKYSLHFEGRSVDLTLWPIDRALYGRLCTLAHCAGFDWVHNEGDHCHASIKADSLCTGCND